MGDPGETRDRLEAIRKRAQEATAGPWIVREYPWRASSLGLEKFPPNGPDLSKQRWVATEWVHGQTEAQEPIWCRMASPYGEPEQINTIEARDAEFIAHAREDIPWLLEANEALLGEVSRLRGRVKELEKELEAEKARQEEVSRGVRTCEGCGWKDDPDDEEGPKREMYCDDDGVYVCAECALTWDDELSPAPGDQEP